MGSFPGFVSAVRLKRDEVLDFNSYPFSIPALRELDTNPVHPKVTYLIGENGSGKSTLLERIAVKFGFNPEGGTRNFQFRTRDSHSELHNFLFIERTKYRSHDGFFLRAETFYNVATEIDRLDDVQPTTRLPFLDNYGGESISTNAQSRAPQQSGSA